jgi:hypothetical protein
LKRLEAVKTSVDAELVLPTLEALWLDVGELAEVGLVPTTLPDKNAVLNTTVEEELLDGAEEAVLEDAAGEEAGEVERRLLELDEVAGVLKSENKVTLKLGLAVGLFVPTVVFGKRTASAQVH